jgi:type II secretory pathway pseudopilin PulG
MNALQTTAPPSPPNRGFTRLELVAVLAGLAVLGAVVAPVLAHSRLRSDRIICANNLRQIGLAMQLWANDHGDSIPQEVSLAEGGTRRHPLAVNVWLHFSWISNELGSAQLLFCPSDQGRPARDFSGDPNGGYLHPNFANRATSYLISHPLPSGPRDIFSAGPFGLLAADRNVGFDGTSYGCDRFKAARRVDLRPPFLNFRWDTNLHNNVGNVLSLDGGVAEVNNDGLLRYLRILGIDNGSLHFLAPR